MNFLLTVFTLLLSTAAFAQSAGDVIINEIANSGTKKAMYTGGDYVELMVVKEGGVKLAGWYLTDVGSPTGTTGSWCLRMKRLSMLSQAGEPCSVPEKIISPWFLRGSWMLL